MIRRQGTPKGRLADGRSDQVRQRGGCMGCRQPLDREVAIWNGCSSPKRGERHGGHVRARAGASARFTAVGNRGLSRRKRATGNLLGIGGRLSDLMLVTGHPGARHFGRRCVLRRGYLINMHAGGSHRAPYPIQDKGDADKYAQQGRPSFHRPTLSHTSSPRVQAG